MDLRDSRLYGNDGWDAHLETMFLRITQGHLDGGRAGMSRFPGQFENGARD